MISSLKSAPLKSNLSQIHAEYQSSRSQILKFKSDVLNLSLKSPSPNPVQLLRQFQVQDKSEVSQIQSKSKLIQVPS